MSNKILSIDVGIKNMAYCVIEKVSSNKEKEFKIHNWGIINILDEKINNLPKCSNYLKKGLCNKLAYCVITKEDTDNTVTKLHFCEKITCQKFLKKSYPKYKIKKLKKVNSKTVAILELAKILITKLQNNKILLDVDTVVIENQPVLKNPTMKSIQMILYAYFVEHGYISTDSTIKNIHLFSARNKLKLYDGPVVDTNHIKNKYNKRKFLSIEYTKYYIKPYSNWLDFFLCQKKKDDLADSFIQGYYYLFK